MKKLIIFFIISFMLVLSVNAEMIFNKVVDANIKQGDHINIKYEIANNFNNDVDIVLTDENIIDGSGYIIECLQLKIPAQSSGILDLKENKIDVELFSSDIGNYTLGEATITFQNPVLNIVDEVLTNTIVAEVKKTDSFSEQKEKKVQSLNLCNQDQQQQQQQQQEQKENQPSKEDVMKQKEKEAEQMQKQQEEMQQQYQDQSDLDKKLEHAQQSSNQDTSATKKAFDEAERRKMEQEQALQEQIESNQEFQEQNQELQQKGYELNNKSVNAKSNNTGDFDYKYENKETGEKANLQGSMQDGKMQNLQNTASIQKNDDYQNLKKELEKQGFKETSEPQVQGEQFSSDFENPQGEKAQITADVKNEALKNVEAKINSQQMVQKILNNNHTYNQKLNEKLNSEFNDTIPENTFSITQKPGEQPMLNNGNKEDRILKNPVAFNSTNGELISEPEFVERLNYWKIIIPIVAIILLIFATYLYKKKKIDENNEEKKQKKFNYKKESKNMLEEAKEFYKNDKKKDAYGKVAEAIRLFYSYKLEIKTELTNFGLIKMLKKKNQKWSNEQKCLNLCGLVEFAKYKPNDKDFGAIIKYAESFIKG